MSLLMKMIKVLNVTICLLFLIGCYCKLHVNSETPDNHQTGLSIVQTENDDDGIVTVEEANGEIEYDKLNVFKPTKEWQTIQPGQAIPAGLHIRMNMKTGEREAKLNEGDDQPKYWKLGDKQGMVNSDKKTFTRDELKRALKDFKSEMTVDNSEKTLSEFKSYKELKEDFKKLNIGVKTDVEIITGLVDRLKHEKLDSEQIVTILTDLEYYLHQIDNAVYFCDMNGMELLLNYLNSTDDKVKSWSAATIAGAIQSNPKAQIAALKTGLMQPLIRLIALEKDPLMRKRYLYTLSSFLRHFPYAQLKFLESGGLSVLSKLFSDPQDGYLQVKVITLLNDLIQEKNFVEQDVQDNENYREKLKQYQQVKLKELMVENGWCDLMPNVLNFHLLEMREQIISAMKTLVRPCWSQFWKHRDTLKELQAEYKLLAPEDDSGLLKEILENLNILVSELSEKIEL